MGLVDRLEGPEPFGPVVDGVEGDVTDGRRARNAFVWSVYMVCSRPCWCSTMGQAV